MANTLMDGKSFWRSRWTPIAGVLAVGVGLIWIVLTIPWLPCPQCGATPTTVTALTPGVSAVTDSPVFEYSPGWQVSAAGADPTEPRDPLQEPSGVVTFTYTGNALWLLLAPGDYWAFLYATVDGQPANQLPEIRGNTDSQGARAGYTTLLAPEIDASNVGARLRWVEAHRAGATNANAAHQVRLEFWRGWGRIPLRAVAIDPAPEQLRAPGDRRPGLELPVWPGLLILLAGGWLLIGARLVSFHQRTPAQTAWHIASLRRILERGGARIAWGGLPIGAAMIVAGTFTAQWPVVLGGLVVLGLVSVLRPALWLSAMLFALPFAYAIKLPMLPGRALGVIDVGIAGGVATLLAHLLLNWLAGAEHQSQTRAAVRAQRGLILWLALLVIWALVASVDVRYPSLALREWRTVFLYALIFALLLVTLLHRSPWAKQDRWVLVAGWLLGATTVSLIGLWGYTTDAGFVSAAEGVRRIQALYDSANNLALYLDRTVAATLALAIFLPGRRARLAYAALAAPQILAWLLTFSKGALLLAAPAMLVVLGGGGVWLLRQQKRSARPILLLGALALIAVIVLAPFIGAERFQRLFDLQQGTGFLRIQLWRSSWQMALDHMLRGVGPDQFLYAYRSGYLLPTAWQEPNLNHPHNVLLDWWTRLGLAGLVLGIGWLVAGIWGIWRWLSSAVNRHAEAALALGALSASAAALAHGLIDVSYALPELMLVWVLLFHLGAATAIARCTDGPAGTRPG